MADILDQADMHAEFFLKQALAQHAKATRQEASDECIDCGVGIPAERRRVVPNACRCIVCQEDYERDNRRGIR